MAERSEIRDLARDLLDDTDASSPRWADGKYDAQIDRRARKFCRETGLYTEHVEVPLIATNYTYSAAFVVPIGKRIVIFDKAGNRLEPISADEFRAFVGAITPNGTAATSPGTPNSFLWGLNLFTAGDDQTSQLIVAPQPNTAGVTAASPLSILYEAVPAALANDNAVPPWDEEFHFSLSRGVAIDFAGYRGDAGDLDLVAEQQRLWDQDIAAAKAKAESLLAR